MVAHVEQSETWVHLITQGWVEGLTVEEVQGRVVIRGQADTGTLVRSEPQRPREPAPIDRRTGG